MKEYLEKIKEYIHKIISDSNYRTLVTVTFGSGWNLVYAMYHLVLAIIYQSYWFLTMFIYYLIVCIMRSLALQTNKQSKSKVCKTISILMFLLAFVFTGIVLLTILEKRNEIRNIIVAITMATYTFYCVIIAIINIINTRKKTVQLILIRNISLVYALGSLYGLERMMLGTFGNVNDEFTLTTEIVSGAIFSIMIVLFGINLLMVSKYKTQD